MLHNVGHVAESGGAIGAAGAQEGGDVGFAPLPEAVFVAAQALGIPALDNGTGQKIRSVTLT